MRRSIVRAIRSARSNAARARKHLNLSHRAILAALDKLEEGDDPIVAGVLIELASLYRQVRKPLCYAFIDEATSQLLDDIAGQSPWIQQHSSRGPSRSKLSPSRKKSSTTS